MGRTNSFSVECTLDKTYHIHSIIALIEFSITDDLYVLLMTSMFHAEEMQGSRSRWCYPAR